MSNGSEPETVRLKFGRGIEEGAADMSRALTKYGRAYIRAIAESRRKRNHEDCSDNRI